MAKGNEYRMAIKIAGEMERSLYNCTDLTRKELQKIAREAAYASTKTKGSFQNGLRETEPFFRGLEQAGAIAFQAVSAAAAGTQAAILGVGAATAYMGMEFESAFAGVKKTTEATAQEYAQIRGDILRMTREIPAAGTEISTVAEAAGQLGIEKENLLAFTRVMIDLGESTNLAAEEGASALAKFANITRMDPGDYSRLGSTIVDLGNNFATTEADIVSMATRMASAGELAGFTEPQIMAMATAMSSVGIEAEAGGSAMSKAIKNVQVAVETGNKSLGSYAKVAGMTADEFKEKFRRDALGAVAAFIGGLNDVERNGKSATVILDEMGLTEVRLSNTLTSLANAGNLMTEAVETANNAWDENVALAKEAGMRYETTESKIAIMKNGITEMGVEVYGQFNAPLREGIDIITELIHEATADIKGSNAIHDLAQDIVDGLPDAIRIMEGMAVATADFAGGILSIGGWIAEHPKLLSSTIMGAGAAIGMHKAAKGISAITNAVRGLGALGPGGLSVLGVVGGFSAVTGIVSYLYQLDKELTQSNIEGHFGDIALSIEEIDDAARKVVGSGRLDKMDELLSTSAMSDSIQRSMEDAISSIKKKKWELGIGLSLSEEDKADYASDVQQYVEAAQEFVKNQGYTVHLSAELLLDGFDGAESIIDENDAFYRQLEMHMGWLGERTSSIISDALEKGLEIDQEEIDKVLSDMQRLTDAINDAEMDARLDRIKEELSGADLDKDSFQSLMQKAGEYQGELDTAALDAYEKSMATLNARRGLGDISDEEYEVEKESLQDALGRRRGEGMANLYGFMYDTILDAYQDEIGDKGALQRKIDDEIGQWMEEIGDANANGSGVTFWQAAYMLADSKDLLDARGKKGLAVLWEDMDGQYGAMQELWQSYLDEGEEVPQELKEAMQKASIVGMLAGDEKAAANMLGMAIDENEEYQEVARQIQQWGNTVPDMIASAAGIEITPESDGQATGEKLDKQKDLLRQEIEERFAGGIDVPVTLNYGFRGGWNIGKKMIAGINGQYTKREVANNADGGIVTEPTISWIAEGGYPESIIPLDGSRNAVSLWQKTGEILGVLGSQRSRFSELAGQIKAEPAPGGANTPAGWGGGDGSSRFVFSPNINIDGGYADEEGIKKVLREMYGEFTEWVNNAIDRRERDKERFNFY